MTHFKEIIIDQDTIIFLTFHNQTIIAVGNVDDILDKIQEEINDYMKTNNYDFINLIYSNNFDVINIENEG